MALPQTVNNYYGATNVINAPSKGMQIVSGNEHVTFSYDQARAAISEIEAAISQEQLQSEDKDAALEMLTEIRDKIAQEKKPGVIKALFVGLKDFFDKCRKQLGGRTDPDKHTRFVLKENGRMGYHPHAVIFLQSLLLLFTTFTGRRCRT